MRILLANPRGFCAGVERAINIVEKVIAIYGPPIYVRHELVHNSYVVNTLRNQGVVFIEQIHEVPDGAVIIFSAHGVSKAIRKEVQSRNLTIFDATCPLVTKVHMEVARASHKGIETILIGHYGHPEVEGTIGQYNNTDGGIYLVESLEDVWQLKVKNKNNLCFITQTTFSVDKSSAIIDALRQRFPFIKGPHKQDICYATTNRQEAVRNLTMATDIVLVVGSKNSSNSNRLVELAQQTGKPAYLIDCASDIKENWLQGINIIGVTAGASAPNILVLQVILKLQSFGAESAEELRGYEEKMIFDLPRNLHVVNK
ncbi:4-hydroxy-3-methylbut-2-enyl diphosphate reductase [Candidatus Palibaumannia cicadellinicola]|uniref:4-hydroxy-3-methylbut-2-enyl diphosphate reductase n=1 Tax=Baumannia cicadellinicola subsp. Homalodisca coagulata TaxID=374463 RepID=ISPH_BAUCH|nr:4-hydroxy-3-methylbut-2-enyl diphosphate reductase [Candidatus Baumannia cicadellinicola]Q1LSS7.1 RecName: Full=4-hydroxy-3-methylbut-2-enyl diphosphate reductase; Short=HMBPP reductase [Baumannia cicadellinicola str. Hc (Homalodisca coagulata)]ABF14306.1 4-hydroxy-3-methylbut-2-enyl diphosphate reductase [Baumannia cicadellinicola str. Hc (Homalodisca coagulata)]MBS0032891.1 4-hydroxy-3-methylbut-2-enyl diphosphate reductase [Candidatus Baumannia cicadellinicola]MCJ7462151.1 4-hydroxy-3-met